MHSTQFNLYNMRKEVLLTSGYSVEASSLQWSKYPSECCECVCVCVGRGCKFYLFTSLFTSITFPSFILSFLLSLTFHSFTYLYSCSAFFISFLPSFLSFHPIPFLSARFSLSFHFLLNLFHLSRCFPFFPPYFIFFPLFFSFLPFPFPFLLSSLFCCLLLSVYFLPFLCVFHLFIFPSFFRPSFLPLYSFLFLEFPYHFPFAFLSSLLISFPFSFLPSFLSFFNFLLSSF